MNLDDNTASEGPPEQGDAQPRVIGMAGALAIVVGSMLGIGIFLTPPQVATHLPSTALYLLAWVAGGFIAFSGAVAYAELGTRFPEAGGDYVFLQEAFGPSLSFAAGWLLFAGVFAGSVATMAVPLVEFQMPVLVAPFVELEPGQILWKFSILELTVARAIAIVLIAGLTTLNILGTRLSTRAQILLTAVPVVLFAVGALVVFATTGPAAVQPLAPSEGSAVIRFGRAVLAVYFAYAGWNAIAYVGGEVKAPAITIPVSLLAGTAMITVLYVLLAGCALFVLGMGGLQEAMEVGTASAQALAGGTMAYAITAVIAVVLLGSINSTVLAGGRVGWAMARRGALFSAVGHLHDRFETPVYALVLQAVLACLLVSTGTFEVLLEMTSVAMFVMGALTVLALFVIRRRDGSDAPYQASGYPWLPGSFVVISALIVAASVYRALFGEDNLGGESVYPLVGLLVFVVVWIGHWLVSR
jgi:APA family basic amino acid/polyamine antiporter